MLYFEHLNEIIKTMPDKPAFTADGRSITFSELDLEAAKVYRFLKEKGIGAEQIVQILMPKELHFFSCMLGVWRAGAAFVLVQDDYPQERIDFIRNDANCVLVLDQRLFDEIMKNETPLEGFEAADPHQLAYVVYTSGSTGTPKGILHEYGNVDKCVSSVPAKEDREDIPEEKPLAGPLSFVHTILNLVYNTMDGITTLLEPEEKLRDFNYFRNFILEKKLTSFYLPPSYIRLYKEPSPYLKVIGTGSEPANGLYYPGGVPAIKNTYSCSEAGFAVMSCILDKAYDVAPIGRPLPGVEAVLMDEDDHIVEGVGEGELCIKNDYFRGYLNQPELTAYAKRGGYFHTADVCRRDADGLYYIVGRADDMMKINGNRIEPAEIEAAVEQVTGLDEVMAKGISQDGRSFVAVYYIREQALRQGILEGKKLRIDEEALRQRLPQYMIPAVYVPLDAFPLTASGKKSRKELPVPDADALVSDYVAPENGMESYLCEKMAEVLGRERVGAEDDFLLYGDSMKCIELVSACDEIALSSKLIFQYKTPREIARHVQEKRTQEELDQENRKAQEQAWPLLPGQLQNIYFQSYMPDSDFLNIPVALRMKKEVDADRLCRAANQVLQHHPGLHVRIGKEDATGAYSQKYEETLFTPVTTEDMTEQDFREKLPTLKAPFEIEGGKLYRCGVIRTEEAVYFYLIIHHVISDGASVDLLRKEILQSYQREQYAGESDYYFGILKHAEEAKESEAYRNAAAYFGKRFDDRLKSGIPIGLRPDHDSKERNASLIAFKDAFERKANRDVTFYMTAALLAEAWYNEEDFAFLLTIYADRDDPVRLASAGYLAAFLALGLDTTKPSTALLQEMKEQNEFAITHTEYSYVDDRIGDSSMMLRFNYQKDENGGQDTTDLVEEKLKLPNAMVMPGVFGVTFFDHGTYEKIGFAITYVKDCYEKESVEHYAELFFKAVDYLEGKDAVL